MEEKIEAEKVGGRIVDPQTVWLAQHGFRPDWNDGEWLLSCGAGSLRAATGTCVRLTQFTGGSLADPWLAKVEVVPDDPWVLEGRVLLATAEGRTPDIAASRCIGKCRDREERLTDPIRTLARVLYATAMEDLREALPDLVYSARPPANADADVQSTSDVRVGCQVARMECCDRRAAMWLAAHGFVPSAAGPDGQPCWARTCGVPGVFEDGAEARLEIWRTKYGEWVVDATVLLSGNMAYLRDRTSEVVHSYVSTSDEGPDAALRGCVAGLSRLSASGNLQDGSFAELVRAVVGRYEKAMAEIEAKPASAG